MFLSCVHSDFRLAVEMNMVGVRKMIDLCKTFKNLEVRVVWIMFLKTESTVNTFVIDIWNIYVFDLWIYMLATCVFAVYKFVKNVYTSW